MNYPIFLKTMLFTIVCSLYSQVQGQNKHRVIFQGGEKLYIEPKTNITWADFHEYLTTRINYPRSTRVQGLRGNIKVSFVIDEQGRITNIKVLESFNKECEEAVLDAMKNKEASEWKHIGKPQKVTKEVMIEFKLGPKFKKK